jgi:hypothetical protein
MSKPTRPDTREFSTTQGYLAAMEGWATHLEVENQRFRGKLARLFDTYLSVMAEDDAALEDTHE